MSFDTKTQSFIRLIFSYAGITRIRCISPAIGGTEWVYSQPLFHPRLRREKAPRVGMKVGKRF
ncbi:hypothetical protein [Niabella soli]|uniref:Uncharacterized protein n=1 Tax=Niabella soli DSM 19437 TaxID=929713 RepID=W0F7Z1_9BACT|nr:hypothetical protein [Niabella soli]AHF17928.1 hypothetical protein NIASO_16945 [Niabella soli DSM 19437]